MLSNNRLHNQLSKKPESNDLKKKNALNKVAVKIFGDRLFVKTFWKLLLPTILWGVVTSVVPVLFNLFNSIFFDNAKTGAHANMYVAVNYTYETFTTVNYFATIFIFSLFPAIGNFVGHGQYKEYRETLRFSMYTGVAAAFILMICEQIWATQFAEGLIYLNRYIGDQIRISVNLMRTMSFIGFCFVWMWLYVPSLSSINNTRPLIYSSIISFIFFIIADPIYLHILSSHGDLVTNLALQYQAAYGIGGIYLAYFAIQPIYVYLYCKFFYQIKKTSLKIKKLFKKDITDADFELLKRTTFLEHEMLLMNDWRVPKKLMKQILILSWGNLLDQTLFNAVEVLHFVYGTNFGGSFLSGNGFELLDKNPEASNAAANQFYKMIVSNPEMLIVFFYGIFNAFSIAPQYFIARELGAKRKDVAQRNIWLCMNWSYIIGVTLMIVVIIFALFINHVTFPADNGDLWYNIEHHGKLIARVQYWVIWDQARLTMIFFGFLLVSYCGSMMGFYVVLSGASKLIVLGDTVGTIIFTAVAMILHYTHFNNPIAYYFIPHLDKLFKYIIYMVIIGTKQSMNSIHSEPKPKKINLFSSNECLKEVVA